MQRGSILALFGAALLAATVRGTSNEPALAGPAAAAKPLPRVTFVSARGGSILVDGTYPRVKSRCKHPIQPVLHSRYSGTIEVGKDDAGHLFVIGVLPTERYLNGLGEVPPTWPMEALKAQAVAARTYALASMSSPDPTGQSLGYQLCATDACQVYLGLGVSQGPYGQRWVSAVRATSHQALLYGGRPAYTFYFSTSNGHTYGNDTVFGGTPLPYLRPVRERDDGASPLSHWRTKLPLSDVARFLRAAGAWPRGKQVASVTTSGSQVIVRGGGASTALDAAAFASDINQWAPCLSPQRYPGINGYPGSHSLGTRLPQTVPSKWFRVADRNGTVVFSGRGWGHGVGMVQWGAEGKAAHGLSYKQILAAYYGGLEPTHVQEPRVIRIGIATGLRSVEIVPSGKVAVRGTDAPGPWTISGGRYLSVAHTGAKPPSELRPGKLSAPASTRPGGQLAVSIELSQPATVTLSLQAGTRSYRISTYPLSAGRHAVRARVPRAPPGRYVLRASFSNGVDTVFSDPVPVTLSVATSPSPTARGTGASWLLAALAAVLLAGAAWPILYSRRNKRRARPPSP